MCEIAILSDGRLFTTSTTPELGDSAHERDPNEWSKGQRVFNTASPFLAK